jgi:hypothetical protein
VIAGPAKCHRHPLQSQTGATIGGLHASVIPEKSSPERVATSGIGSTHATSTAVNAPVSMRNDAYE